MAVLNKRFPIYCIVLCWLCACGVGQSEEWRFERAVSIVCPWGVGSGADTTLRTLTPLLEKELGVPFNIVTKQGGGGVDGVTYAATLPADGYHFLLGTQSMIMADLQGRISFPFREAFTPVVRLVHAVDVLVASDAAADNHFENFAQLCAYATEHPGEVTCAVLSLSGVDALALNQTLDGYDVALVEYDSGLALNAAVMEGDAMLMISGTEEIMGLIERRDVLPLAVLNEARLPMLPDVPCTSELGIDATVGSWRGLWVPTGTPEEAICALENAIARAVESKAWTRFLIVGSYDRRAGYSGQEDFKRFIENEYGRYSAFYHRLRLLKRFYGEMD